MADIELHKGLVYLQLTVYHEARGESDRGQRNVVKVILNRAKARGWKIPDIVFARKQFSCWNDGLESPNVAVKDIPEYLVCSLNCVAAIDEWLQGDTLGGATHYYALAGMPDRKPPYWAAGMKVIMKEGGHTFLKERSKVDLSLLDGGKSN